MPTEIYLVKAGMTMTEGTVEEWYVADGAAVTAGELVYRLETEKINLDVDADAAGIVKHLVPEGTVLEPGAVVGYIYAPDESIPAELPEPRAPGSAPADTAAAATAPPAATPTAIADGAPSPVAEGAPSSVEGGRVAASPAARKLAAQNGVDLNTLRGTGPRGRITEQDVRQAEQSAASAQAADGRAGQRAPSSPVARKRALELEIDLASVTGTGPGGRITKEDVEQAAKAALAPVAQAAGPRADAAAPNALLQAPEAATATQLRGIRKTIADRMFESLRTTAQLTIDMEVAMGKAMQLREQLNAEWAAEGTRISYTDLIVVAATKALTAHPMMNSTLEDDIIHQYSAVHLGIAVALEQGLVVPVVRNAHTLSLGAVSAEATRLADAARAGSLSLDELQGGTFTVTSLGMYGVDTFTPILNAPQTGILGVGRIYDGVAWSGDTPVKASMMRLSLTWDHRVLDGAPAAEFLDTLKSYLEQPFRLLL